MAWSVLQSNSATQATAATTFTTTYSSNLTSGTILLAAVTVSGARTISSVKDGALNAFTLIGTVNLANSSTRGVLSLYAVATPSGDVGTKPTITATLSSSTDGSIWIGEISGIQIATDGSVATGFGSTGTANPTYSDTAGNEFFITIFGDDGGPETSSVTGGWTVDAHSVNGNSNANVIVAYGNSTNGTESDSWTSTGTTTFCGALSVAFKLTASAPSAAQPVIITTPFTAPPAPAALPSRLVPLPPVAAVSLSDSGTAADNQSVTAAVPLADSGAGSDALTVAVAFTDTGSAADNVSLASTLADSGSAADTLAAGPQLADSGSGSDGTAIATALADSGAGTDSPIVAIVLTDTAAGSDTIAESVPLGDTGTGSDAIAVTATVSLTDSGSGTDVLSTSFTGQTSPLILTPPRPLPTAPSALPRLMPLVVAAPTAPSLADAGAGADGLAVAVQMPDPGAGSDSIAAAISITDSAAGSDALAPAVSLPDAGSAADTVATAVTLSDTGSGAESISVAILLADTGSAADTVALTLSLADTGSGIDALVLAAVSVTLSDTAVGADTIRLAIAVSDHGGGSDALSLPPAGNTGTVRWFAGPLAGRWTIKAVQRWAVQPAGSRWKAVLMANFTPIAAISLEEVNVLWTSDLAGTVIDPTATPLVVQMAFPVSSGVPGAPAQPVTWYTASWLAGTTVKGYVAQCLVGPGGVVTLTSGQSYDVWSKISGTPEIPARFAGVQQVY